MAADRPHVAAKIPPSASSPVIAALQTYADADASPSRADRRSNAAPRSVVAQIGAEVQSVRSLNQRQLRACLYAIEHNFRAGG